MSNPTIHNSAATGFTDASFYDAHRPSYPNDAVGSFLDHLGVAGQKGARVIDLAAGTGKLTESLAGRPEGFEVVAVEPHESMRQTLEAKNLKGVISKSGTAEEMPAVQNEWADAVVVAQAFHWFSNEESLREIHRVLKPGGKLGLIWNIDEYNKPRFWKASTDWEQQLNELVTDSAKDGQPRVRDYVWKDVFDQHKGLFTTPLGEEKTQWTVNLSPEGLWDRASTLSHIAMMQGEARDQFHDTFVNIVKGGNASWEEKGEVVMHGCTLCAWTTKV